MAKYISVLSSDMDLPYWKAVQWDSSLASIEANDYYSAGVNMNLPKNKEDKVVTSKKVKEISTFVEGTATIIRIAKESTDYLKLASNNVSKSFWKNIDL